MQILSLLIASLALSALLSAAEDSASAEATTATGTPPKVLHVDGKRILDSDGAEVWLQGVSVPSLEWSNSGENVVPSIVTAITSWKANIIRLPVSRKRWFGTEAKQADGGAAYRAVIDQAVQAVSSRGAWIVIDLHHYRAPSDEDVRFWQEAALLYKDNPAVLYGLFNEPHGISWEVWRNGGALPEKKKPGDEEVVENQEQVAAKTTPGLQGLITAVRGTGAKNIVVCGGLNWSYDLSGILTGYALDDLGGNGVVYDAHVYPWKRNWQKNFLDVAAVHPVLLGEVGCDIKRYDFVPKKAFESPYTWAPDIIACIQKNRLNWTAWAFHAKCGPPMLLNTKDYAPTPFWGAFVRDALGGKAFESDKLR